MIIVGRKLVAIAALVVLGWMILTVPTPGFPGQADLRSVLAGLLVPLLVTIVGIAGGAAWGRWLGLAAAIAVAPWAVAFVAGPSYGLPMTRPWIILAAAVVLLLSLAGRGAFEHFDGRVESVDWRGRRMGLVRWTTILSVAAVLNLYVFAVAYSPAAPWQSVIPGAVALGLVGGAWLLGHGRTAGLLVTSACCLVLPFALVYFVMQQPVTSSERILFGCLFLPAWLAGSATVAAFFGPMRRFVRD